MEQIKSEGVEETVVTNANNLEEKEKEEENAVTNPNKPKQACKTLVTGSADKSYKFWDLDTYTCTKTVEDHTWTVHCLLKFSEDVVISGSGDHSICYRNMKTDELRRLWGHNEPVRCLLKHPTKSEIFLSGSEDKIVAVWDKDEQDNIRVLDGIPPPEEEQKRRREDEIRQTREKAGPEMRRRYQDEPDRIVIQKPNGHMDTVRCMITFKYCELLKKGPILVTGSIDCSLKLWDIENNEQSLKTFKNHSMTVNCLVNLHSDEFFASAGCDKTIIIWNTKYLEVHSTLPYKKKMEQGHTAAINSLLYLNTHEKTFASASSDRTIKIWNYGNDLGEELIHTINEAHNMTIWSMTHLDPIRNIVAVSGDNSIIKIWDIEVFMVTKIFEESNSPYETTSAKGKMIKEFDTEHKFGVGAVLAW